MFAFVLVHFLTLLTFVFIGGIQKRKDRPANWFSNCPIRQNVIMKRIMSGRKFSRILRYLHVCPLFPDPEQTYDPSYKVSELLSYLQGRFAKLFIPGRQLSLDETLIRMFGRIKFKVRIISKAARYGIKMYVLTDAVTAFVLHVVIYTGKSTYSESLNANEKKTVAVVKELCKSIQGSHRTVYVDRFYTLLDLIKELHDMDIYITGTIMKNRIPKELTIAKSGREYKQLERGDIKRHVYTYRSKGKLCTAGLVCWKDRDIVYCLSNESDTVSFDSCTRRTKDGLVTIRRPRSISDYNKYMGGVDLADMRRLHCNSTIMGQNRWWLKLFFYLLDVGTSNALVLHNFTRQTAMTVVDFKMCLVQGFLGDRMRPVPEAVVDHLPLRTNGRYRCVYCSLFNKMKRTRFRCNAQCCLLPLCSVGTGSNEQDCFILCHGNETIRQAAIAKFESMKKSYTTQNKSK